VAKTPLSQKKFLWAFIASWLVWAVVHAWLLNSYGIPWEMALPDSVISNALVCGATVIISNNLQYYMPKKERYWFILAVCVFETTVLVLGLRWGLQQMPATAAYSNLLDNSFTIRSCIIFLQVAVMAVMSVLWYTFEEQQKIISRKTETEQLAREAELFKLRQQLQPHFLFNSLNSINALIGSKPAEARSMIQQLSSFLRNTLRKEENQWVPLQEELEQLELYLSIEKVRFGNRLQTVVEANAIKFGLYGTTGATTIEIHAHSINNQLVITIINPFDSDSPIQEQGTGFGLKSVKRRLYLLFARNDLVETEIQNNQFIVSVTIPQP
jgi:two-component system, LytTR family, sensor kinase